MLLSNELIFILHVLIVSISCAVAAQLKKEALIALLCIQAVLSNLFVIKQISLLGFYATPTDVFTVGSSLCLNLLQDQSDKKESLRAIYISFFILIFYTIMSQFQIFYDPACIDTTDIHFQTILQYMPRIIAASIFCYFISQNIDAYLYNAINQRYKKLPFIIKNYTSISISQLIDTLLFSFLGLYGLVESIWHIAFISFTIKVITLLSIVPLTKGMLYATNLLQGRTK